MGVNKPRAQEAIKHAERELKNGLRSFDEEDYTGALKYFQECSEYAAKAVLIAYGVDYPKIHGVGRLLIEKEAGFPKWFGSKVEMMAEAVDTLARDRPRFRYPYEYRLKEQKAFAQQMQPKVKELFKNCKKLVNELFK